MATPRLDPALAKLTINDQSTASVGLLKYSDFISKQKTFYGGRSLVYSTAQSLLTLEILVPAAIRQIDRRQERAIQSAIKHSPIYHGDKRESSYEELLNLRKPLPRRVK